MKSYDFSVVVRNIPKQPKAIFRITKIPAWINADKKQDAYYNVNIGDEFYYYHSSFIHINTDVRYDIGPSYLEFVEYRIVD